MKTLNYLMVFLVMASCSSKDNGILPMELTLTESVYASATVQPDSLYQVYASISGILDKVLVEEGDLITENNSLFEIINATPKLNTQNAKLALDLAKENFNGSATVLESIKDEITAEILTYKNDSINYYRQKNLWDQNIGSKVQYDEKKLKYELTSNKLKLLENKLNRTKNELLTAVKQARNNYQTASITTSDFTINSKISGKVYALYKEPGEIVTSMEPLASIGSSKRFIIELLVDEVDIVKIIESQDVIIHLDAYKDKVFNGSISKIYPKKDERNQTFTIEAVFVNPPKVLYPGLSGEANIIIGKKENVLTIPKPYLVDSNKVKTNDGLVTVKVGLQNMDYVEILSGITKDTHIYKSE